jgi:hypothetical protein
MYPEAERVKVTFDLLRYDQIGVYFSKEDNRETWRYLVKLCQRLIEDDGTAETINPSCMYCVRKASCQTLLTHQAVGGMIGVDDPYEIADILAKVKWQMKALKAVESDLSGIVTDYLQEEDMASFETDTVVVKLRRRQSRKVDAPIAARIIGEDIYARYATLGARDIDALLKGDELDDNQKVQLKSAIRKEYGNAWLDFDLKGSDE